MRTKEFCSALLRCGEIRGTTLFLTKAVMVNYLIFPDRYDHRLNRVEDPK